MEASLCSDEQIPKQPAEAQRHIQGTYITGSCLGTHIECSNRIVPECHATMHHRCISPRKIPTLTIRSQRPQVDGPIGIWQTASLSDSELSYGFTLYIHFHTMHRQLNCLGTLFPACCCQEGQLPLHIGCNDLREKGRRAHHFLLQHFCARIHCSPYRVFVSTSSHWSSSHASSSRWSSSVEQSGVAIMSPTGSSPGPSNATRWHGGVR